MAYLGTAFHSSTKDDRYAHKAIDGNYDTSDSECASTVSETIPWWILELDQTYSVSKIVIQTSGKLGFLKGHIDNTWACNPTL